MVTLLVIAAIVAVVLMALYWRTVMPTTKSLQKSTPTSKRGSRQREGGRGASRKGFVGEDEILIKESIREHPTMVAGHLRKQLSGGGTHIKRVKNREWPSERISDSPTYEDTIHTQNRVDTFLDEKKEVHFVSPSEMKLLVNATDERWRPLMVTACYTGIKASELFGLLWEDIDFGNARICVRRTYQEDGRFHAPDLDSSERSIIVPPIVIEALENHRARQAEHHIEIAHHFVFTTPTGIALNRRMLSERIFEPALRRAGLSRIHFDDLRYSYEMALSNTGERLAFIQRQLGRPSDKEPVDTHEQLPLEDEKGASNRIALIFGTRITPQRKVS